MYSCWCSGIEEGAKETFGSCSGSCIDLSISESCWWAWRCGRTKTSLTLTSIQRRLWTTSCCGGGQTSWKGWNTTRPNLWRESKKCEQILDRACDAWECQFDLMCPPSTGAKTSMETQLDLQTSLPCVLRTQAGLIRWELLTYISSAH